MMAVMTAPPNRPEEKEQESLLKRQGKPREKTRPITATLDHPLILDIKLLKRLDMTTFTKKGLIALSKFCGISLINKMDSKRKLNKCAKTIQYLKKQAGGEGPGMLPKCPSDDSLKRDLVRVKRKPGKQMSKAKPRIRFKVTEEGSPQEEDSSDVVCKRHEKGSKGSRKLGRKAIVDEILSNSIENVVPEPCKTCSRSEHPERFHSHPKMSLKMTPDNPSERNLEERFKNVLTTKDSESKSQSAKDKEGGSPQVSVSSITSDKTHPRRAISKSPKSNTSTDLPSPETEKKKNKPKSIKKPSTPLEAKTNSENLYLKKSNIRSVKSEKDGAPISPVEEAMKFVTGCYICGRQVSAKSRIKHEETCIGEWRTQNSLLSPNERKPEPKRPDFRFTASGDLDCEGTFDSIWANHKDSLVPCKKCGRRFFPDRIERHENCCNNIPITVKYKH